jgi:hypothetical protein
MTKADVLDATARGEGCLGKSADDEPVFVLVARDVFATSAVDDWIRAAERAGVNTDKLEDARRVRVAMRAWRLAHDGGKVPD